MEDKKDVSATGGTIGRRDLMKFGVASGVAAAIAPGFLAAQQPRSPEALPPSPLDGNSVVGVSAEETDRLLQRVPLIQQWPQIVESEDVVVSTGVGYNVHTGPGWKNNSGRHGGNGPMDITTTRLAEWTAGFNESMMTPEVITAINYLMLDYLACFFSGYETDAGRASARMSQRYAVNDFKSTVYGYGISTTPEMAAFANGGMGRLTDFDDHNSALNASCIAVGEANHSSGMQVMQAIAIAYEIQAALGSTSGFGADSPMHVQFDNWDISVDVACASGHLLGLNADYLGNAISLALLPHMPIYSRIGTQTNWKGFHAAEQGRNGVFAALIARDGMTGPCMPFEGRDGLIAHLGPYPRPVRLPASKDGTLAIVTGHGRGGGGYKRFATEGTVQTFVDKILPQVIKWTKAEEIEALELENTYYSWQEICDPPKWDPQNRETADHSFPYNIARGIIDGKIYFDSFYRDKYLDPKARELMAKLTIKPRTSTRSLAGEIALKVRKKSGEEKTFAVGPESGMMGSPFTNAEIEAKFKKSADFFGIKNADEIMQMWTNLKDVKDIGQAIAVLKQFRGYAPRPLSDTSPSPNS